MKIIYGQDSFVIRVIMDASVDFDIANHLQSGEQAIDGVAEPGVDKVVNGVLIKAPPRPSNYHYFDKQTFAWILNLATAKTSAKDRITKSRNDDEANGFEAYGKTFDSDASALQRISVAVQAAQAVGESFSVDWTCADNSVITLDYGQVLSLPVYMAQAANAMHIKARTLKAQIDAATTLEEINAVVW